MIFRELPARALFWCATVGAPLACGRTLVTDDDDAAGGAGDADGGALAGRGYGRSGSGGQGAGGRGGHPGSAAGSGRSMGGRDGAGGFHTGSAGRRTAVGGASSGEGGELEVGGQAGAGLEGGAPSFGGRSPGAAGVGGIAGRASGGRPGAGASGGGSGGSAGVAGYAHAGYAGGGSGGFAGTWSDDGWAGAAGTDGEGDCTLAAPVFLAIPDRVDLVFDEKRCVVYVTTSSGVVERYDIRGEELAPLVELGGTLVGIDLSPDQDWLLVADAESEGSLNHVHVLDLAEHKARKLYFETESLETGTFMPLFIGDDSFLLSSRFGGSGWVPLRQVTMSTGAYTSLASIMQDTMLSLSADGTTVALAESNSSAGPISRYSLADHSFEGVGANWFVYEVAVNRDATQYAVPVYDGLYVYSYDGGFEETPVKLGKYTEHYGVGVAYSPDTDILYVSFTDVFGENSSIEALDTNTFETLFTVDADPGLVHGGNNAFVSGRLRIARSGNLIGATIANGVRLYSARAP